MKPTTVTILRAMFSKEWRDVVKWAVIGSLGLCIAIVFVIGSKSVSSADYHAWPNVDFESFWSNLAIIMTIGSPVLAVMLAMAQIFPELRRDHWAFLIHRPATRTTLFWGKAITGLCLYVLAAGLPFLLAVLWARTPGNLAAPFDWRLTLQGLAMILAGSVYYFGAFVTALRPARWFGSRLLPLATGVMTTMLVGVLPQFWLAILIITIMMTVMAVAAHGSFLTTGHYDRQPKSSKAALGFSLYLGIMMVIGVITVITASVHDQISSLPTVAESSSTYEITTQGKIVRFTTSNAIGTITDLSGKPVRWAYQTLPIYQLYRYSAVTNAYNAASTYAIPISTHSTVVWFYSVRQNGILGYSTATHQLLGYLTPSGFVSEYQAAHTKIPQFPGSLNSSPAFVRGQSPTDTSRVVLQFGNSIFEMNGVRRALKPLYRAAPDDEIVGINTQILTGNHLLMGIATKKQILLLSPNGSRVATLPVNEDPKIYPEVQLAPMENQHRFFLWYLHANDTTYGTHQPSIIKDYQYDGTLINRVMLPAGSPPYVSKDTSLPWYGLVCSPALVGAFSAIYGLPQFLYDQTFTEQVSHEFAQKRTLYILFGVISIATSLMASLLAWLIGRRCAFHRKVQWAWTMGVFLLGLPGVLLMLSLFEWPVREICPTCRKKRVVNHIHCEYCGSEFLQPAYDGTEIFEEINMSYVSEAMHIEKV